MLPYLLGPRGVAGVHLKAARANRILLVPGAFAEAGAPAETAEELAAELWRLAGWLGLDDVAVGGRGDLSDAVRNALER